MTCLGWMAALALLARSRARAELVARACHELRSPLTAARLAAEAGRSPGVDALAACARGGRGRRGRGLAIALEVARGCGGRLAAAPSSSGTRVILELPAIGGAAPARGGAPLANRLPRLRRLSR